MRKELPNIPYYQWNQFLALSDVDRKNYIVTLLETFDVPLVLVESLVLNVPKRSMGAARSLWKKYGLVLDYKRRYNFYHSFNVRFFNWVEKARIERSIPATTCRIETELALVCTWEVSTKICDFLDFLSDIANHDCFYPTKEGCIINGKRYEDEDSADRALYAWERKTGRSAREDIYHVKKLINFYFTFSPEKAFLALSYIDRAARTFKGDTDEFQVVKQSFTVIADQDQ